MATFDSIFVKEVKALLNARVQDTGILQIPLPKEAGGSLDIEALRATQNFQQYINYLGSKTKKPFLFSRKVVCNDDEISQEAYEHLLNCQDPSMLAKDLVQYADQQLIGATILNNINQMTDKVMTLQNQPADQWKRTGKDLFKVSGIPEDTQYFNELNNEIVFKTPKGWKPGKRKYSVINGGFERNKDGSYKIYPVNKATGSILICTTKNLKIPYNYKSKRGYSYVDFYEDEETNKRIFIYEVPKKFVFRIEQLALVLTKKTQLKSYEMVTYHSWQYGKISLAVIPYSPNKDYVTSSTKVLATAYGNSVKGIFEKHFQDKQQQIVNTWIKYCIIGNPADYIIEDDYGQSMNLIVDPSKSSIPASEFKGISKISMEDENTALIKSNNAFEQDGVDEEATSNGDDDWGDWDF